MSFSLKLLGGAVLEGEAGPVSGPPSQRHRLALLALLVGSRPPAQPRDKLLAWLWPEHDQERARGLLNQAVHALRRALGAEVILSTGDDLRLNPAIIRCDVSAFEEALAAREPERAVALYGGPFLDGFFLDDAPEFEQWVARERDRLEALHATAVESLAEAAERTGEWTTAAAWWKARSRQDPYDSRVVLRLMAALERDGNPAGSLRHGIAHQQRLREDLEIDASPAVQNAVARLRRKAETVLSPSPQPAEPFPAPAPVVASFTATGAETSLHWWARRGVQAGGAALVLVAVLATAFAIRRREAPVAADGVDAIAQAVARELDRRAQGDTAERLPQQRTTSIPAYELYLRGDDPALLRSDSTARRGLEYLERAVALDSNYAAAWAGVARLRYRVTESGYLGPRAQARALGEAAALRAVTLDPSLGEGHAILGIFRAMAGDYASAEEHLLRAVDLEPTQAHNREWLSNFYLLTGRPREALEASERAVALDPLSPSSHAELARALIANDRCPEALAQLKQVESVEPPLLRTAPLAAQCYGRMGRWAEAIEALRPQAARQDALATALLGYMDARAGRRDEAAAVQARLEEREKQGRMGAYFLAFVPAGLGDRDQAFNWLELALRDGSLGFAPGRTVPFMDPPFEDLRRDARFESLRARVLAVR